MKHEIVDIVDENGCILRQATKHDAHKHGWLHKTVIGHVRRGNDWVLVCQTSDRQDAGQFVAPVGGHVRTGESEIEALSREAHEEIGVRNISHNLVGSARFHRQILGRDENHLFIVYEITTDDKIILGDEADSIEQFTDHNLKKALLEQPENFGDGYYFVLEHFYQSHLPEEHVYRWKLS